MKLLHTIILLLLSSIVVAQSAKTVDIKLDKINSTYFDESHKKELSDAFIIMNAVFNSHEYQSLYNSSYFPCWNHCKPLKCKAQKQCGYYHQSDPGIIIQSDPPKLSTRLIA
jgi:hypothetical protein